MAVDRIDIYHNLEKIKSHAQTQKKEYQKNLSKSNYNLYKDTMSLIGRVNLLQRLLKKDFHVKDVPINEWNFLYRNINNPEIFNKEIKTYYNYKDKPTKEITGNLMGKE